MPQGSDAASGRFPLRYAPDTIAVQPDTKQVGAAWSLVGGVEEEASLELHLVVAHPTEPGLSARVRLSLPLIATDGVLHVGTPTVTEA